MVKVVKPDGPGSYPVVGMSSGVHPTFQGMQFRYVILDEVTHVNHDTLYGILAEDMKKYIAEKMEQNQHLFEGEWKAKWYSIDPVELTSPEW